MEPLTRRPITSVALAVLLVALAGAPHPGAAQERRDELDAIRQELEALKGSDAAILSELREIKTLLRDFLSRAARAGQAGPPPAAAPDQPVSVAGYRMKGGENAKVVLMDFTDYQ